MLRVSSFTCLPKSKKINATFLEKQNFYVIIFLKHFQLNNKKT